MTPMTQDRDILAEAAVALPHNTNRGRELTMSDPTSC